MKKRMILLIIGAVGMIFPQTGLFAAGGGGGGSRPEVATSTLSADFRMGKKAVEAKEYRSAISFLIKAADETPDNADVYNLLGFSYRKLGELDKSLTFYNRALSIDPKHRGANEYIGELFLQTGDLSQAEKHLKVLDKACFFGCEEYDELKEEIAKYKSKLGKN